MNQHLTRIGCYAALAALAAGCGAGDKSADLDAPPAEVKAALESMTSDGLLGHITRLSSDEFEGRAPATRGEELTVAYLTEQFQALGLKPGNPDGRYVQKVPMVGFTTTGTASFQVKGKPIALRPLQDYVAVSRKDAPTVSLKDSELVFVGYGVVAPEYGWDDFKDVDVRGKTVVMLINDPAVPDASDPSRLDPDLFKGEAMTYYGRWTYKYEIASEKGAAGAIIVHETGPAGYPFEVVSGSWGRENFDVQAANGGAERVAVEGWITTDKARELFQAAGQDFDALKAAAVKKEFRPVPLGGTASFQLKNTRRTVESQNVVAKLEGAKHPDEYVVYTAHWDHLGMDPGLAGDQIFNGALDNASGTSGLLEIAKAYTKLPTPPDRSVLFLAVTAEEKGLLGAKYYANAPLYPLEQTLANINMDGINQWGRTSDLVVVGFGNSTLDDVLAREAAVQKRTLKPDPEPEKGFFYRSDHFEFAKKGVPALYVDAGVDFVGKPAGYGEQKRAEYTANDYHKPSDEVKSDWDLTGAIDDLQLLFMVGYRVANGERWPEWKPGTEFKAVREKMLSGAAN